MQDRKRFLLYESYVGKGRVLSMREIEIQRERIRQKENKRERERIREKENERVRERKEKTKTIQNAQIF